MRCQVRIVQQRIRLHAAFDLEPSVALVAEAKDASETVEGEVADFEKGESGWLAGVAVSVKDCRRAAFPTTHHFAHVQLDDLDSALNHGRFVALQRRKRMLANPPVRC